VNFYPSLKVERLETNREHKGKNFSIHNIPSLPQGIWQVHLITRPFCISRKLLVRSGGLNKSFMPHTGDDIDLSLTLLRDGYQNLYVSFDLINISTISDNQIHGSE
jgi:GT2 family glycosyltransferase